MFFTGEDNTEVSDIWDDFALTKGIDSLNQFSGCVEGKYLIGGESSNLAESVEEP